MSENDDDDDQQKGQEQMEIKQLTSMVHSLIHETALKRRLFDDLVNESSGNRKFINLVARHMKSMKINVKSVTVPPEYVRIDIYDNSELGQIALHDGLVIFSSEEIKKDTRMLILYAIDHEKKILYTNTSSLKTTE